jgi:hypothetical protein
MTKMPSKREVAEYRLLSDEALQKFKIFCAAGRLPRPDKLTKGAFDSLSPQLKRQLGQLTPAQKKELRLGMDVGENEGGQPYDKDTINRLMQSVHNLAGDMPGTKDDEFTGKLMRFLDKTFPGCCGELSGEDEEAGETGYSPEEDMADDDEGAEDDDDEVLTPAEQFRRNRANSGGVPSAEKRGSQGDGNHGRVQRRFDRKPGSRTVETTWLASQTN